MSEVWDGGAGRPAATFWFFPVLLASERGEVQVVVRAAGGLQAAGSARRAAKAVTMRAIANELGVKAASLYYHVRDKDALFDLVLRHVATTLGPSVVEQFQSVETLDEWIDVTRRTTLEVYDFHEQHQGIAALILSRAFSGDAARLSLSHIAHGEADALVRVGLPQPAAYRIYQTCARWTLAAIAAETDSPSTIDQSAARTSPTATNCCSPLSGTSSTTSRRAEAAERRTMTPAELSATGPAAEVRLAALERLRDGGRRSCSVAMNSL